MQSTPKIKAKMHPRQKSPVKEKQQTKQHKTKQKTIKKRKTKKNQQQTEVCNNFSLP